MLYKTGKYVVLGVLQITIRHAVSLKANAKLFCELPYMIAWHVS